VLVKPDYEEVSKGGIVIVEDDRQGVAACETGKVVGIGPTAWHAYDKTLPDGKPNTHWEPWAKVGDRVVYARYGGKILKDPDTKEKYIMINDVDVQVVVEAKDG
jgi:co-chaperonin GroES (HSP10)